MPDHASRVGPINGLRMRRSAPGAQSVDRLGTFLVNTHDPFGASVALRRTAESLMDLAPYINDARDMELILLGGVTGKETDGHDWNNLPTMTGLCTGIIAWLIWPTTSESPDARLLCLGLVAAHPALCTIRD